MWRACSVYKLILCWNSRLFYFYLLPPASLSLFFFFHFVLQQPCKVCGIIVQNFTQEEKYYLMDEQLAQVKRIGAAKVLCPCEYF